MKILKKLFGLLILLIGVSILGWIAYNYLVAMQPEARGRNPLPAVIFSGAAIWIGGKWLVSKT